MPNEKELFPGTLPELTDREKEIVKNSKLVDVKVFKDNNTTFSAYRHPTLDGFQFTRYTGRRFISYLLHNNYYVFGLAYKLVEYIKDRNSQKATITLGLLGSTQLTEDGFALISFFCLHYVPGDCVQWAKTEVFENLGRAIDKYEKLTSLAKQAQNN